MESQVKWTFFSFLHKRTMAKYPHFDNPYQISDFSFCKKKIILRSLISFTHRSLIAFNSLPSFASLSGRCWWRSFCVRTILSLIAAVENQFKLSNFPNSSLSHTHSWRRNWQISRHCRRETQTRQSTIFVCETLSLNLSHSIIQYTKRKLETLMSFKFSPNVIFMHDETFLSCLIVQHFRHIFFEYFITQLDNFQVENCRGFDTERKKDEKKKLSTNFQFSSFSSTLLISQRRLKDQFLLALCLWYFLVGRNYYHIEGIKSVCIATNNKRTAPLRKSCQASISAV